MGSFAQKQGTHNSPASQMQTTKLLFNHTTARLLYILFPSVCKETVLHSRYSFKPFSYMTGEVLEEHCCVISSLAWVGSLPGWHQCMEKSGNVWSLATTGVLTSLPLGSKESVTYEKEIILKVLLMMAAHNTKLLFYTEFLLQYWILFKGYNVERYGQAQLWVACPSLYISCICSHTQTVL